MPDIQNSDGENPSLFCISGQKDRPGTTTLPVYNCAPQYYRLLRNHNCRFESLSLLGSDLSVRNDYNDIADRYQTRCSAIQTYLL
jgi:hypothetical protein